MFAPTVKNLPAVGQKVRLAIKEMETAAHKAMGTLNKAGNYVGDNMLVRHLYQGEAEALWYYFGHFSLHVTPIVIYATSLEQDWSPYGNVIGLQPKRFTNKDPHMPVNIADPKNYAALVHESFHVWQRQHGEQVSKQAAPLQLRLKLYNFNPYLYNEKISNPKMMLKYFLQCNVEQQAQIFEDYVVAHRKSKNIAKFVDIQMYVKNKDLSIYSQRNKLIYQSGDRG